MLQPRDYPKLIAICGHPKSGKSEVQRLLHSSFGYQPVDDGLPMRAFCVENLGMRWDDVTSQEGKAGHVEILGRRWQRREILGVLGNHFEAMFGQHIMPFMATVGLEHDKRYSFGSVRRDQGLFYRERGGLILGVRNPDAPPSPFEFDRFDESLVDIWIDNDFQIQKLSKEDGLLDLGIKVATALSAWRARKEAA